MNQPMNGAQPQQPQPVSARAKLVIDVDLGDGRTLTAPVEKMREIRDRINDVLANIDANSQVQAGAGQQLPSPAGQSL